MSVSEWTITQYKSSKQVEVAGVNDKRQIAATFAASLSGLFLSVQLVYPGKTSKCHPSIDFQKNGTLQILFTIGVMKKL